ncbi:hypothetical protein [Halocatena pleomorpha]|uniref:Uncharacterized protein n=1 Tax=Halocatena pleomorpha TaxID=1785090 RepID=A0A3P3RAR9_9EURY|nr:hypothetical protein [Halocatena pleomorpha]RRJ29780.1 hypothetical protein EIK79_11865 [Halocatena pleomorpha]
MNWTRLLGAAVVLVVGITTVGSLLTLGGNGLQTGQYTGPTTLTTILVAAIVLGLIGLGVRSSRFLSNPYW